MEIEKITCIQLGGEFPDFVYRLERYAPTRELLKDLYFRLTFRRNLGCTPGRYFADR